MLFIPTNPKVLFNLLINVLLGAVTGTIYQRDPIWQRCGIMSFGEAVELWFNWIVNPGDFLV